MEYNKLRNEFFEKHTVKDKDGIPKVHTHPHNLFEWFKKQLKLYGVSHCACTPDETTGTTSVSCCNICGKPAEDFWRCG